MCAFLLLYNMHNFIILWKQSLTFLSNIFISLFVVYQTVLSVKWEKNICETSFVNYNGLEKYYLAWNTTGQKGYLELLFLVQEKNQ